MPANTCLAYSYKHKPYWSLHTYPLQANTELLSEFPLELRSKSPPQPVSLFPECAYDTLLLVPPPPPIEPGPMDVVPSVVYLSIGHSVHPSCPMRQTLAAWGDPSYLSKSILWDARSVRVIIYVKMILAIFDCFAIQIRVCLLGFYVPR